jgi:anti-sigma regulatory factor (Ser/Thr protein kinase)
VGRVVTDGARGDTPTVDDVARRALAALVAEPGVHRAGLALTEGGGRRLRFTASDRTGVAVEWCHIDAYDDVPLTLVVRTGERVAGTVAALTPLFPEYAARQVGGPTVALVAAPLVTARQVLGGVVVFLDDADAFGPRLRERLTARADDLAEEVRRAQLRSPRTGGRLADEPVQPGTVVAGCEVEGDPRAVGTARRFARAALAEAGLDDDLIDTAVLCLSEIVTNAVIHTGSASELRVSVHDHVVTIAVRDQGSHRGDQVRDGSAGPGRPDDLTDVAALADPLRVHGRGLQLVDALSARWGSELDDVGTTVWFVLEAD